MEKAFLLTILAAVLWFLVTVAKGGTVFTIAP